MDHTLLQFSIVVMLAKDWQLKHGFDLPKVAWYHKPVATVADALALVRQQLWQMQAFQMSGVEADMVKVPRQLFNT